MRANTKKMNLDMPQGFGDGTELPVRIIEAQSPGQLPEHLMPDVLVRFFHEKMKPYHDEADDVRRGLDYALSDQPGRGGVVLLAELHHKLVGGLVMLNTGMKGYVPEYLLLFVAVHPESRGRGIGEKLIRQALERVDGAVKLHVEPDNPALRLYQRIGFESKYLEMRCVQP